MTETRDDHVTWLTQEAYDRLKAELDHLSGPGRVEIAKKIEAARDEGDLRENGGYHAAKEEQGKQEARINQIQHILQSAKVGEPPRTDGVVGPGMTVTVRFDGDDDEVTFLLASREESGSPIDVYSPAPRWAAPSPVRRSARPRPIPCRTAVPPRSRSSRRSRTGSSEPGPTRPRPGDWAPAAAAAAAVVSSGAAGASAPVPGARGRAARRLPGPAAALP